MLLFYHQLVKGYAMKKLKEQQKNLISAGVILGMVVSMLSFVIYIGISTHQKKKDKIQKIAITKKVCQSTRLCHTKY